MFPAFEKYRIDILGAFTLVILTLATGISVYVVMQKQVESVLSESLKASLQKDVHFTERQIHHAIIEAQVASSHPSVIQNLQLFISKPGNATGRVELQGLAKSLLAANFRGLSIYDASGHEVARAGHFSQRHDLRAPLKTKDRAFLLWDGEFLLQISKDVLDQQGHRVGMVMTEAHLYYLTLTFKNVASVGKTGEFAVCAPLAGDEKNMDCFLGRVSGKDFQRIARVIEGKPLPMNYALNGGTGVILAKDYRRQQVVAAYAPVGLLGLGMVLKVDRAELFHPTIKPLKFIAPLLAALVLMGILLLHFLVRPLVRKLVDSERATRAANTLLHAAQADLRQFKNTLDQTLDCVFMFDSDTLLFTYVNKGAIQQVGYSQTDLMQMTALDIKPEFTLERFQQMLQPLIEDVLPSLTFQTVYRHKDGHDIPVEIFLQLVRLEDQAPRFVAMVTDITARQQAEVKLQRAHDELEIFAATDALTGCANRREFEARGRAEVARVKRSGAPLSFVTIDLDHFKQINDRHGHRAGDEVLRAFVTLLKRTLRPIDWVGRIGGEEFALFLPDTPLEGAVIVAERLRQLIESEVVTLAGTHLWFTASLGVAQYGPDGDTYESVIEAADSRMYRAKQAGRNQVIAR
ncbi:MAG: diguanylate cyclase [Proteobacteria bacterium]|nr:diguanylate cyclase [Pseudomonadota bacterium]